MDDVIQVALMALVKAADRFDERRGVAFTTFAYATIRGEIKRHFRDAGWGMHVDRSVQEAYLLVREAVQWSVEDLGRTPTDHELAVMTGLSVEQVGKARAVEEVLILDSTEGAPRTARGDSVPESGGGTRVTSDISAADPGFDAVDERLVLRELCKRLSPSDRRIFELRFIGELTQAEIARQLDMSQMSVSRALRRILSQARRWLTDGQAEEQPGGRSDRPRVAALARPPMDSRPLRHPAPAPAPRERPAPCPSEALRWMEGFIDAVVRDVPGPCLVCGVEVSPAEWAPHLVGHR